MEKSTPFIDGRELLTAIFELNSTVKPDINRISEFGGHIVVKASYGRPWRFDRDHFLNATDRPPLQERVRIIGKTDRRLTYGLFRIYHQFIFPGIPIDSATSQDDQSIDWREAIDNLAPTEENTDTWVTLSHQLYFRRNMIKGFRKIKNVSTLQDIRRYDEDIYSGNTAVLALESYFGKLPISRQDSINYSYMLTSFTRKRID